MKSSTYDTWRVEYETATYHCGPNNCVERDYEKKVLVLHNGTVLKDYPLHMLRKGCFKFGITVEQWAQMYQDQNGVCAICEKPESRVIHGSVCRLSIDHCHETGKVRALLCDACNTSIGRMNDDPDLVWKSFEYLVKFKWAYKSKHS